ncbi:MAG: hypothetical protein E7267_04740 [Lachnospiraceae bacterium]|nr:hypothetical protein [Lachnospiraceae bacterium]
MIRPDKDIVLTGWIAGEGTRILAEKYEEELKNKLPRSIINRVKNVECLEGSERLKDILGEDCLLYEAGEGGIFAGLWNMAETLDTGVVAELSCLRLRQETIEVCEFFDINPYMLCTKGTFLIVAENGNHVVRLLAENGYEAEVIGYTHSGADRVVLNDGETRFLESRIKDELEKFI